MYKSRVCKDALMTPNYLRSKATNSHDGLVSFYFKYFNQKIYNKIYDLFLTKLPAISFACTFAFNLNN